MADEHKLSSADVRSLLSDPSTENRSKTAAKIGTHFTDGTLSDSERRTAEDIFRLMIRDLEVSVRKSLSHSIRLSKDLPRDIAITLANDVADVALPIITYSELLTDEDLINIVATKPEDYQCAVASRAVVSEHVSKALVQTGNETVVAQLVANEGAIVNEATMAQVLDTHGHIAKISNPMANRKVLPLGIAERLVNLVSTKIRDHLVTHHDLSPDMAMDLLLDSRERATLHLLDGDDEAPDVVALVDQLYKNKRLSDSIVLRAICMGDISFFEAALARKANISVANAYQLIHDRGQTGLERLFEKAQMPANMLKVVRMALQTMNEIGGNIDDRQTLRSVMMERVVTQFEDGLDDMDYFIAKLSGRGTVTAHAA